MRKKLNFLTETQYFAETEPEIIEKLNFSRFLATLKVKTPKVALQCAHMCDADAFYIAV